MDAENSPTVTIYSIESCQGCRITMQMLEKAGIEFQSVDLTHRPDLIEQFRAEGLIQAPVLEHQGERTAGFRPDRIRSIVSSMNGPDAGAIHAASQSSTHTINSASPAIASAVTGISPRTHQ